MGFSYVLPAKFTGNIRPHVISLLFRSLVSSPLQAVNAAHYALRDVLSLSVAPKTAEGDEEPSSQSRLPKDLLQTCIRPVLLHLREYTKLTVPLLRGLARLLSLLSSWFNKTLGEKLLDHLRKWTDPGRIIALKIWKEGKEPLVAAAIVGIFSSLPHAAQFVEHLVKTCIKLESTLPSYKARFVESPYRRPLARYLNKHAQYTVSFFFPRLKTPMYSELFQHIVQLEDSTVLRDYLSNKQCSVMLLNVCFERPLAIIRSEKSSLSGGSKGSLFMHGIDNPPGNSADNVTGAQKPMNIEALEMQHQGFRLVSTLLANDPDYFRDHNDIVRAFRWLWRSKGRFLRLQHEDLVSPRFHDESKMLASFLMNYAKSFPSEDLDILFELFRVFLQPSTADFAFVSRFLVKMVSHVLTLEQKRKVIQRFFASVAGDTNEEIKVLGIQFLIFPMLAADCRRQRLSVTYPLQPSNPSEFNVSGESSKLSKKSHDLSQLTDDGVIQRFVKDVIFHDGTPINCGDRLRVELLRLLNLFAEYNTVEIEPFKKEMVKYCWGLLKSEDMPCKCWAYVVVCRFISAFDTPMKIVRQVYISLLRLYQQESKELVRAALDLLVPALPSRLEEEDLSKIVEQTNHFLAEEGISVPHLAHISQTIVRNPEIFQSQSISIAPYLINSLARLGLPPTGVHENRFLAVSLVELLLLWDRNAASEMGSILADNADTICSFLIRLKLLIPENSSDARSSAKADASAMALDHRVTALLDDVFTRWGPTIRAATLEKCIAKDKKATGPLRACVELISTAVKFKYYLFLSQNSSLVQDVITLAVEHAHDDVRLQKELENIVSMAKPIRSLTSFLLIALEKVIEEAICDQNKATSSDRDSDRSRSKERPAEADDMAAISLYALFALELISVLCHKSSGVLNGIATTLISLAKTLSDVHLSDAASKQRQGSSNAPRTSASGIRHHTPTIGILEESCMRDQAAASKLSKARAGKDDVALTTPLRCLISIMSVFESSDVTFTFTKNRKMLLQIVNSILETSDNLQLLMAVVRCVGKWIILDAPGTPLTSKERNSLLERIAAFDLSNLLDDVVAQPLADLVSTMVLRLSSCPQSAKDDSYKRLAASCLLNAHHSARVDLLRAYVSGGLVGSEMVESTAPTSGVANLLWLAFHTDLEGLCARFWRVVFVDVLMQPLLAANLDCPMESLLILAHGSVPLCLQLLQTLLPWAWDEIPSDLLRLRLAASMESLLAKTYHSQILRSRSGRMDTRCLNSVRTFLNIVLLLNPIPVLDSHLLVYLAENYNCWYEVLSLLEKQYSVLRSDATISAIRHCYKQLGEDDLWCTLARESCMLPKTSKALSLDIYDVMEEAASDYAELMGGAEAELESSDFEMDLWEERWVLLQKELCQFQVVSEFANASEIPSLQLECAWKSQDWAKVRSLCLSTALFAAVESGDAIVKMSETLLAVADGKLSDVENLHAQTAQLCLYRWQLLPRLSSGSLSHASLLHFFHRLVEIRESGQIMVETSNHSTGRTLPDLKNLLSAWRHRLPNDWEKLSMWDEVFAWRAHMFSAITSNFHWCEPDTLATQHDRPWTALRMAKTARKQGLRDVALLLLSKAADEQAMNVSDAYVKLREQILAYSNPESNPESKLERHGGLNLINATNLSFFDASQKGEIFRLKALFLQSLLCRSKANQAYCHSVQICPTHARAWDSWGELCASLGTATEKQIEQGGVAGGGPDANKDVVKKVRQYLAQAMGCYIEAIQIDGHEWARIHIPKCLWMLTKDSSAPGVLCQTLESRGVHLPAWVWLPWIPQLLTCLYRHEGRAIKSIFARLVKAYPQAVYYPLRAFYLERRDVDRVKSSSASTPATSVQNQGSVAHAEELMSLLRKSHASLWSSLESCLEELIVKFRPSYEEELLATIIVLLERAEMQVGSISKNNDEESVVMSVWRTLGKIAVKFFRPTEQSSIPRDARAEKTAQFKDAYKGVFESDFHVSSIEQSPTSPPEDKPSLGLDDMLRKLGSWKIRLEDFVLSSPNRLSLIESSHSLAMFGVGDPPDLWPGSCDPPNSSLISNARESNFDPDAGTTQSTTSSAAAARKAARNASKVAAEAALREGVGGDYGGGSSYIEIPGQYIPNTSTWTDVRPSPELHAKLLKFEPSVSILRRCDTLVRRIGMVASDGKSYYFLLQFAVPYQTRTDERTSQTHYVLDKVLRKVVQSARAQLSVQSHAVIPVAQRLRLISEPDGRTSLEDIYRKVCADRETDHSEFPRRFNDEVKRIRLEKTTAEPVIENGNVAIEKAIRLDVFSAICSSDGADDAMLIGHLVSTLQGPEPLYQFRRMFAQQWGANCLLQYAFSTSERTPSKVVFDYCSGRVLAPEFRIAYTNQGSFESQPTPFRLTPNLTSLIGTPLLDARFTKTMAVIAGAIKACKQDLDPIFRLLMRDDLVAFYTKSVAKSDSKTFEMEKQLAGGVGRNVAALHTRFAECAPKSIKESGDEKQIHVDQQVRDLIVAARKHENLCLMSSSFQGWL